MMDELPIVLFASPVELEAWLEREIGRAHV